MRAPMDFQEVCHRRAPDSVNEVAGRSTGRAHLISLETVSGWKYKESDTLTFTTYCFEHGRMLGDSCASKY